MASGSAAPHGALASARLVCSSFASAASVIDFGGAVAMCTVGPTDSGPTPYSAVVSAQYDGDDGDDDDSSFRNASMSFARGSLS